MGTADQDPAGAGAGGFKERARREAERYGADPWVFVRELLQNARDAGATRVDFSVFGEQSDPAAEVVVCQDDGEGMSFEDARRYLFALYASSKEHKKNQVGKFGVGFWSILRFEPVDIVIRSRPRRGAGWGVLLDRDLAHAVAVDPPERPGTEITLRRPRHDLLLEDRVYDAVWQTARHVCQRDDPDRPLVVTVNGRQVNAEFALPAPSSSFRRRQVRGVVGLGSAPRVELFSRGLRVRSAARLEDLLAASDRHSDWLRVHFPELPDGLAPVALLESAELDVMLSRADVRDTRALAKLVRLGQRELRRLIERQLDASRPSSWWWRVRSWLGDHAQAQPLLRGAAALVIGGLLAFLLVQGWGKNPANTTTAGNPSNPTAAPSNLDTGAAEAFQDLGARYRGPTVDGPNPGGDAPVLLRYSPPGGRYYFAALTFSRLGADGAPVPEAASAPGWPYRATSCPQRRCLQIELGLRNPDSALRIPVPTGHRVVAGSLKMNGQQPQLRATAGGQALVLLESGGHGRLRYQTAPAKDPTPSIPMSPKSPTSPVPLAAAAAQAARVQALAVLPADLQEQAQRLQAWPVPQRMAAVLHVVQQRVAYDDSAATAALHRAALGRREGFIARTLAIGAGDCDVQNGLVTAIAQAAGVPARLAVGYLGEQGRAVPRLHAWVEYRHQDRWFVADATAPAPDARTAVDPAAAASLSVAAAPLPAPAVAAGFDPATAPSPAPDVFAAAPDPSPAHGSSAPSAIATPAAPRVSSPLPLPLSLRLSLLLLALLFVTAAAWSIVRARTRRAFKLDARIDVAKLLRGVLQQPRAFGSMSALLHRPLVPVADGSAITLAKARELAHRGRLFGTTSRSSLATAAMRAGAVVLDLRTDEGKAVADALGAADLDAWVAMIDARVSEPLLDDVNRVLRRQGEEWAVAASSNVKDGLAALDLGHVGGKIAHGFGTRLVMVDGALPWLADARRRHRLQPQAAVFLVLDEVARRLGIEPLRRVSLLADSARAAIMNVFGEARSSP